VDFQLSDDQEDLLLATRNLCETRLGITTHRASLEQPLDRRVWSQLVQAGILAVCRSEADGGLGLGLADAAVVFCELGRTLVPGPVVWTLLAGNLPAAPALEDVVGGVDLGPDRRLGEPAAGLPLVVEHLGDLDVLYALDADGIHQIARDAVEARPQVPLDPLTPVSILDAVGDTEQVAGAAEADRWRRAGAVLAAAQLSGLAAAVCERATEFARDRHQFGRPIGSFQAIKHTLADMWVRAELARPQVLFAAASSDEATGDADRAASAAKIVAGDAAVANAQSAVQVHGGMGYTWEADPHLFLKRAWALDCLFGTADEHAAGLAAGLA
jgi:alkylation response protein AidB-like acyl-CoA dehydrogenase